MQDCNNNNNNNNIKEDDYHKPNKFVGYQAGHMRKVVEELEHSGFYYEKDFLSEDASDLLKDKKPGDFIVRQSSSLDRYFTLTFKNKHNEIKNVRIGYSFGVFYFITSKNINYDTSDSNITSESVIKLIELHLKNNLEKKDKHLIKKIYLKRPVKHTVLSLKHLCLVSINQNKDCKTGSLPKIIQNYTNNYPYKL